MLPNAIAFNVFSFPIRWYSLMIVIGMIVAVYAAQRVAKLYGWSNEDILDVALIAIPLAILGARLYYVLFDFKLADVLKDPLSIFRTWDGGLAIFGGIIGGVIGGYLVARYKKKQFLDLGDIAAPSIAIGQAFGRWGNFFNQEAFGPAVVNKAHQFFPMSVEIGTPGNWHYATFFYESAWCLLIFIVLVVNRKKFKYQGDMLLTYLLLYSIERSFVEGMRTDSLMLGSFRVSQLLSILLAVVIVIYFVARTVRHKKHPAPITHKAHPDYLG